MKGLFSLLIWSISASYALVPMPRACNPKLDDSTPMRADSEIVSYWDEFQADALKAGLPQFDTSGFEMGFRMTQDDTDFLSRYPRTVAFCQESTKRIIVKREYWQRLDYWGKRLVLRHEFGHCFLNLEHTHALDAPHTDLNIMDAGLMDATEYARNASQYDTDLFRSNRTTASVSK